MGKFASSVKNATTSTTVGAMIAINGVSKAHLEFVEMTMTGSGTAAPADIPHTATWDFSDGTTPATDTAQTPRKFNDNSAVSIITNADCNVAPITGVTATIIAPSAIAEGFNQRGGMRWAVPQGEGVHLDFDATNMDAAWRADAQATGAIDAHIHWWEP